MKIAFFSDIHANFPALEAVLEDIEKQEADMVFCLGDLVGYAPWPNIVIEEINKRKIVTIAGKHDEVIASAEIDNNFMYLNEENSIPVQSNNYTIACIKPENRNYLKGLPTQLRLVLKNGQENIQLLLFHGSLERNGITLTEESPDEIFQEIFDKNQTDFLIFGHSHKPFYKRLSHKKNHQTYYRHAINIGSVGKPKDGDPRACYVILAYDENSSIKHPDGFKVSFIRVRYNIERAVKAILDSPLPDQLADMLIKAY